LLGGLTEAITALQTPATFFIKNQMISTSRSMYATRAYCISYERITGMAVRGIMRSTATISS
ncbi:MAG: hypothetical protein KAV87_16465, partial [Desulfobacteraceae bacterium]|nr:hypothetical protein [Desulfobacteraceae bacterium]